MSAIRAVLVTYPESTGPFLEDLAPCQAAVWLDARPG